MSDDPEADYKKAERELHAAINAFRQGKEPIPFTETNLNESVVPPYCSFCGKGSNQVRRLIAGPAVYICNECVLLAVDILGNE